MPHRVFAPVFGLALAFAFVTTTSSLSYAKRARNPAQASVSQPVAETLASGSLTVSDVIPDPATVSFAEQVPTSLLRIGIASTYYSPYAFVVDKKERTLSIWTQENGGYKELAKFPADLGRKEGDKRSSGDARTPEGVYFLQAHLTGPSLDFSQYGSHAFTTDYPNFFDRRDGKTGNGIWLHAVPDNVALTRGSRGCVVVRNNIVGKLGKYIQLGKTPILIQNQVEKRPASQLLAQSQSVAQTLEGWRAAWEAKDIDKYIGFYGEDFKSQKMNRAEWKTFKTSLNAKYQQISVKLSRPVLLRSRDRIIARFVQHYTSDQHSDVGEKTVYLRETANGFKIVGEDWNEDNSAVAGDELNAGNLTAYSSELSPRTTAAQ